MRRAWPLCVAVIATMCMSVEPVYAQRGSSASHERLMSELTRLRQAASFEAAGRYGEAEAIVADVLAANPTSLSGLLTMERVLTAQGRKAEIMPAVDRLLAEDPASVIGHQTRIRVLSDLNDVERLPAAIDEWTRITPKLETPYREGAIVWRNRGEHDRAIALLEQGRKRIERPDALALELGDAYAARGDTQGAAAEWARAIGESGRGLMLVQRRLQVLPDGGARAIPPLVEQLSAEPSTFARQRAAAVLAIEAGLEAAALRSLRELSALAPAQERETLLVELARQADAGALYTVALAAYRSLLEAAPDARAALAVRTRVAELALLAGDTALAAATYRQLESAAASGSPQRRQAVALRIQLTARDGDLDAAVASFDAFRAEFADAPELDATAAAIGRMLLDAGRLDAAGRVLSGVDGAASAQLRGRLNLRKGDIETARHELISAAPLLRGRDATATIALAALLTRVSAKGGEIVARVVAAQGAERAAEVDGAVAAARTLPARERAAILDFLANTAEDAGLPDDAAALRREIIDTLPRTQEAPAALLELARYTGADPEREEEARVLLETLIVDYPRSALAPQARAELQRMQAH